MMNLLQAMNTTATTDNGCVANHSSLSKCVDFFYLSGASRGKDIKKEFIAALVENEDVALRTLQWLRDVREGAGERQLFRDLTKVAVEQLGTSHSGIIQLIAKIPELGRFDDLIWLNENCLEIGDFACHVYKDQLKENNGLAFKWCPIKGNSAKKLRNMLGFKKEADWRKYIVAGRKTVEQQMCAKEWNEIDFSKVPSLASARYQKAFGRNAQEKYVKYLEALVKGETKINASAVYPYDVIKSVKQGNKDIANQQWKALPNYLEGNKERILPVIDVSGSMSCPAGKNSSVSCMDVAISLGLYVAEHNDGIFKDIFMTFHSTPQLCKVSGTLSQKIAQIIGAPWGMNTDLQKVFITLLQAAVANKVPESEMPTTIIFFSDMQFDNCVTNSHNVSAYTMIDTLYSENGYNRPNIVFWNLNASNKSIPVTIGTEGTALVSGFSPSLMKSLLNGGLEPETTMLSVVMNNRYSLQ